MLFLPDAVIALDILGSSGMNSINLSISNLYFSVLTLTMCLRYCGSELYNRGPNKVIAFSWRDCDGFQFVGYCSRCLNVFWFLFCVMMYHQYLAPYAVLSSKYYILQLIVLAVFFVQGRWVSGPWVVGRSCGFWFLE